jgi:uncharacterized DUF497 family protein
MIRYTLHGIDFEWDERKAKSNQEKHGVTFEAACEVFFDPFLFPLEDIGEQGEIREAVIGMTVDWQVLYVVFVGRDNTTRIISARSVTRQERLQYENQ